MSSPSGRVRKRPVSFGNPALGTYGGVVYTVQDPDCLDLVLPEDCALSGERMVALVGVPPEQVPEGILNLARHHRAFIEHVRIVINSSEEGEELKNSKHPEFKDDILSKAPSLPPRSPPAVSLSGLPLLETSSKDERDLYRLPSTHAVQPSPQVAAMENAAPILAADTPSELSVGQVQKRMETMWIEDENETPSRTYLILVEFSTKEAANEFVKDLDGKPYTSLDETQVASVHRVVGLEGAVSLTSPFFCASATSNASAKQISARPRAHSEAENPNCAVCLEHMDLEHRSDSLLTTVCNHSFHLDCLLKCKDSPCPVCRYDHAGLNEALSQCHLCGSTQNNFVCLICGVVSCGGTAAVASAPSAALGSHFDEVACRASVDGVAEAHLPPQNLSPMAYSHAKMHYDETLHAYALDTETQHVWDFAGQGYVHRLLQNSKDGKLVEVNDPNSTSEQRTLSPGLSDTQEGEVVHRKLEGFASQYYTLLKSQLEQQRLFYEGRLEEIRREYTLKRRKSAATSDLISAIKQERNQLTQRTLKLRERYDKVAEDVSFLKNMNESLEANKAQIRRQIQEAQKQRAEAREMIQKSLPPLEEKVTMLMLQLEEGYEREGAKL